MLDVLYDSLAIIGILATTIFMIYKIKKFRALSVVSIILLLILASFLYLFKVLSILNNLPYMIATLSLAISTALISILATLVYCMFHRKQITNFENAKQICFQLWVSQIIFAFICIACYFAVTVYIKGGLKEFGVGMF